MDYLDYIFLIGRVLFGGFFLLSGIDHFRNTTGLIQYAKSKGVPAPKFSVVITGIVLILGGVGIILGFYQMYAAILIGLFLLLAAFKVHAFWKVSDPQSRSNDRIGFTKNIALLGAALVFISIPTPWALSVSGTSASSANSKINGGVKNDTNTNASSGDVVNSEPVTLPAQGEISGRGGMELSGAVGGSSFGAPSVASITVFNQAAAIMASVSLVSTDSSAWLAVREDRGGLVGNILGAKRVDIGTTANVSVPLQRSTEAGKIYHIVLFKDDGDRLFDFKVDPPMISSADSALISKSFLAI
ncbi:MAG: DoxX family protein [Patescibacteria group bacterium]